jgi:mono/diheme cytochrome c family protein
LFSACAFSPATTDAGPPTLEVERWLLEFRRSLVYQARAGDCISCHTANGGHALAGGGRLNTPFGYMLRPNITPHDATGIGLWSSTDFYRALHTGVDRAGEDMYPTMPYDFYTRVAREDSDAIYAYLRTLHPVTSLIDIDHLHFPFDERWTMGGWRELYFKEATFTTSLNRSAAWNRGANLVEGLGHCSACHSRAQSSTVGLKPTQCDPYELYVVGHIITAVE